MPGLIKGFIDVRTDAQLLAEERIAKGLKYTKKNPLSPKLRSIVSKVSGLSSGLAGSTIGKYALRGAAKASAAAASSQLLKAVTGKLSKPLGSIQKASSIFGLGVQVIEETNPAKLRRPLIDGPSINAAQAAKNLADTTAKGVLSSLVAGVPLASGLPAQPTIFKSLTKIKASKRFFDARKATAPTTTPVGTSTSATIVQQRGLLQDEIFYRLVLLAENVYDPIADYAVANGYGRPVVLEGFRSENSSTSQHERGEAIDIALAPNSPERLYELAIWIRDNVAYDQLILCHSSVAGGQSWIHISYTPEGRRRQVLTKTFNDVFEPGLHLYVAYRDANVLAADQAIAAAQDKLASDMLQRLAARDSKLNPVAVNTEEQTREIGTTGPASTGPDGRSIPPQPKAVYVGHPGGTCGLPAMPPNDPNDHGTVETPSYLEQVEEAQAEVFLQYGNDPAVFNTDGSVVDEGEYCELVANVLRSYGFCAAANESRIPADEVWVKHTNEFSDHYDLVNGTDLKPHAFLAATLRPAAF